MRAPLLRDTASLLRDLGKVSPQRVSAFCFHPALLSLIALECVRGALGIQAKDTTPPQVNTPSRAMPYKQQCAHFALLKADAVLNRTTLPAQVQYFCTIPFGCRLAFTG